MVSLLVGLLLLAVVLVARQRRQARAAERLEKAKFDFLLLASHELRTPMSILAGYISMYEDGSLGQLPAAATAVLPTMERKADEMQTKLEQILLAISATSGRLDLASEAMASGELVLAAIEGAAGRGHDRARFVIAGDSPAVLRCDPTYSCMALTALLDNAARFSPGTAPIRVRVRSRGIRRRRVDIVVADSGPGVRPEASGVLFSRFGRLPGPEDSHLPGAGLGLYLARAVARAQGGDVFLRSSSRQGSEFVLRLPAA